jgi:ubiquinone/menaquinone biosynthesis C-methylase UbiE
LNPGSTVKDDGMTSSAEASVPNHHAHYPGFAGASGLLMALAFTVGRTRDADLAIALSGLAPGEHVVDVGCGPGNAVRRAARLGATATGIDPAPVMLRMARWFPSGARVRYLDAGAESLPLEDASADVVWSIAAVHHWPDLAGGLAEVHRVLRPGGRFVAIERHSEPGATGVASHGWTGEQVDGFAVACREAGLVDPVASHHTTGRGKVVAVLAKKAAAT